MSNGCWGYGGRLVNLCTCSTSVVDDVVNDILSALTRIRIKKKLCYRCVLTNALASRSVGVLYSRDNGATTKCTEHNPHSITNRSIIECVDYLTKEGYLINHKACRDTRRWNRKKEQSMFFPTKKLLDLFSEDDVECANSEFHRTHEGIVMRDNKKNDIPYTDDPDITKMRKIVSDLNHMNDDSLFHHMGRVIAGDGIVRIFNENFDRGGRWYRCAAQSIRQRDSEGNPLPINQTRLGITIDYEAVAEIDYCSLHPVLLCAMKGIDVAPFYKDMYSYMLPDNALEKDRDLFKIAMNIMFNATTETTAVRAIREEMACPEYKGKVVFEGNPELVLKQVKDSFPEFSSYFCNENCTGLYLQNIDSKITEKIIEEFIKQDVPILPIHDSYLCQEKYVPMLQDVMEQAFREVTNSYDWEIPVKISYCDGTSDKVLLGKLLSSEEAE